MARGSGIDYGAHSFKVVDARVSGDRVSLRRVAWLPRPGGSEEGIPEAAAGTGLRLRKAALAVSGRDSILRYTHVPPVPPWRLKMIMDYEIEEIASKGGGNISADYQMLNVPREVDADLTILVGMAKDEQVSRRIDELAAAGFQATGACPSSLALFNAYRALGDEVDDAALLIDIGHASMDIAISQAGHLIFARSVQVGGRDFTEAVMSHLAVSPAEAETLKHEKGAIQREGWETPKHQKVSDALMTVVANLLSVIQSSVKFCRAQTKIPSLAIERVFLSGGGSRLRGLAAHLSEALKLPVDDFDPVSRCDLDDLSEEEKALAREHSAELAVPIGLAIGEASRDAFHLDLLPTAMKTRREFKSRTVFLYASGAVAALIVLLNLVWSITVRVGEAGRADDLAGIEGEVGDRGAQLEFLKEENERMRRDVQALADETRGAYFLGHVFDALGTATPPQVSIAELGLLGGEAPTAGAPIAYELSGSADDATGEAFVHLERFQAALKEVKEFSSVEIDTARTKQDDKAGVLRFVMIIRPSEGV